MTSAGQPELRQARKTVLIVGCAALAAAGFSIWRGHPVRSEVFAACGILLLAVAAAVPAGALAFHRGWMKFAAALGYVNSRILLSVMYYGVLTPAGLVMRLAGRDPLNRRGARANSYWIPRTKTRQEREQYERLF